MTKKTKNKNTTITITKSNVRGASQNEKRALASLLVKPLFDDINKYVANVLATTETLEDSIEFSEVEDSITPAEKIEESKRTKTTTAEGRIDGVCKSEKIEDYKVMYAEMAQAMKQAGHTVAHVDTVNPENAKYLAAACANAGLEVKSICGQDVTPEEVQEFIHRDVHEAH